MCVKTIFSSNDKENCCFFPPVIPVIPYNKGEIKHNNTKFLA